MAVAYNTIDADGHILEPLDLWDKYIDPAFRDRRPRFTIDENGKERLKVEGATRAGSAASARSACGKAPLNPIPSNMPKGRRAGSTIRTASSRERRKCFATGWDRCPWRRSIKCWPAVRWASTPSADGG